MAADDDSDLDAKRLQLAEGGKEQLLEEFPAAGGAGLLGGLGEILLGEPEGLGDAAGVILLEVAEVLWAEDHLGDVGAVVAPIDRRHHQAADCLCEAHTEGVRLESVVADG